MNRAKKLLIFIENLISNKIIKWILIPCLLLLLWLFLSLIYSSYKSFTVLQYNHNRDKNNNFPIGKLVKNKKIIGEFVAKENNLGIISVHAGFFGHNLENLDKVLFRIRQKGSNSWYYETVYDSGFFNKFDYSPFGFPSIDTSKGKVYEFEIVSLNGNLTNALEVNETNPLYISKYKFSQKEIFKNNNSTLEFFIKKISIILTNRNIFTSSSVFLLPLVFYLTWMIINILSDKKNIFFHFKNKKINLVSITKRKIFTFLVLILIFNDILFFQYSITGIILGLLGFWIFAIYLNNFKSNVTFLLGFIITFTAVLSIYLNWIISLDKVSLYVLILIVIGLLQDLIKYKN